MSIIVMDMKFAKFKVSCEDVNFVTGNKYYQYALSITQYITLLSLTQYITLYTLHVIHNTVYNI